MSLKSIKELDFSTLCEKSFFPSPAAWEDQVLYFLMLDRFSDNNEKDYIDIDGKPVSEGFTSKFVFADKGSNAHLPETGHGWKGGNLKGLTSKIGYLKRLGVTAIWISPIFKQVEYFNTYHGYGIQNFLEIDRHFGTKEELVNLVQTAHNQGIYVVLDIILNHTGDIFEYENDRSHFPRWDGSEYTIKGYRNENGEPSIPFGKINPESLPGDQWQNIGIWPEEFQASNTFTRKGNIGDSIWNWENDPEYLEGDFCGLKDVYHGPTDKIDSFVPADSLKHLCEVYKYWLAFADLDGFRIDTVKHMSKGATRFFTSVIKEFAQSIGKENFYLIGEITGGRKSAYLTLEVTGLDAALGINDIPDRLEYMVKGYRNPKEYFGLFRNSELVKKNSHIWFRNKVVTMYDDHDQVRKGNYKARFCAKENGNILNLAVMALNATTLGIPCVYYGSEQDFAGEGNCDCYLRENMFGGDFGAFNSKSKHFFNEDNGIYKELSKILKLRKEKISLRRGRQYLREISGDGEHFGIPEMVGYEIRSIIPWSRIFNDDELLLAINTDINSSRTAWVTLDNGLHRKSEIFTIIYSTDNNQIGEEYTIHENNGKSILLTIPSAGFVILEKMNSD